MQITGKRDIRETGAGARARAPLLPISSILKPKYLVENIMSAVILSATVDRLVDQLLAVPTADLDRAASYARAEKSPATRTAYKSDFNIFHEWCARRGAAALHLRPWRPFWQAKQKPA